MNNIPERQNSEPFLRLLRARSQLYREVSRQQIVQLILTVASPMVAAIIGLWSQEARPFVALWAILITVADVVWLDRSQRRKREAAAKVSERFDCSLLGIPWNTFIAGKQPTPEMIEAAARDWRKGDTKLRNWYPAAVGKAPQHLARIICQRANIWYDSELRQLYGGILLFLAAITVSGLMFAGIYVGLSLDDFVITILTPAAPVLIWSVRECLRQRDAAKALMTIREETESLWERAVAGICNPQECSVWSREFQNAIYQRRVENTSLILPIYRWRRPRMEMQMNAGAEDLLREIGIE